MSNKYLIGFAGLLQMGVNDLFTTQGINAGLILKDFKKFTKLLRKNKDFEKHYFEVFEIAKLFRDTIQKMHSTHNKATAGAEAKEIDKVLKEILDMSKDDEYIILISALYIGKNIPLLDLEYRRLNSKSEWLYSKVVEIVGVNHDSEVVRASAKIGQVVTDYLLHNKKINYSIKKVKPKWAS